MSQRGRIEEDDVTAREADARWMVSYRRRSARREDEGEGGGGGQNWICRRCLATIGGDLCSEQGG